MRKRIGLCLLMLFAFTLLIKNDVSAARTKDGWEYKIDEYGELEITGYYGKAKKLKMPKKINGKLVHDVMSDKADWNNETVEELIIPGSTANVMDNNNFTTRLKKLKKIKILNGISSIDGRIFKHCDSLEEVILPDSLSYLIKEAFYNCRSLRKIYIGKNLKWFCEQDVNPFRNCKNLSEIVVNPGNKEYSVIDNGLYASGGKDLVCDFGKNSDKTYIVRSGVQVIYDGAITSDQIENIQIPSSVVRLFDFDLYCQGLLNIDVDEKNPVYCSENGILYSKSKKILMKYPRGRWGSFIVPEGVLEIQERAFSGAKLNQVILPDTVKEIGFEAFNKTKNLLEIKLSSNVESYDNTVFKECGIEKLIFPNGTKRISQITCLNCPNLKEVVIPESLTDVVFDDGRYSDFSHMRAFSGCTNIEKFTVAEGNKEYYSEEGVMYEKNGKQLFLYPPAKEGETFVLQERQNLEDGAFYDTKYLRKIVFKKGFSVDDETYPFVNCKGLMIDTTDDSVLEDFKYYFMFKCQECYLLVHKKSNILKQAKEYGVPYKLKK